VRSGFWLGHTSLPRRLLLPSPTWQDVIGPGGALRFPKGGDSANLLVTNDDGSEETVSFQPRGG
jgi:hypothetical protein